VNASAQGDIFQTSLISIAICNALPRYTDKNLHSSVLKIVNTFSWKMKLTENVLQIVPMVYMRIIKLAYASRSAKLTILEML
jgi:hypothetical protein